MSNNRLKIYISRSNNINDTILLDTIKAVKKFSKNCIINYYEQGTVYSDEKLRNADIVLFLVDRSTSIFGKGFYTEYELAKSLNKPFFGIYKRIMDETFNFYNIIVQRKKQYVDWSNYANAILGTNITKNVKELLVKDINDAEVIAQYPLEPNDCISADEFRKGVSLKSLKRTELLILKRRTRYGKIH